MPHGMLDWPLCMSIEWCTSTLRKAIFFFKYIFLVVYSFLMASNLPTYQSHSIADCDGILGPRALAVRKVCELWWPQTSATHTGSACDTQVHAGCPPKLHSHSECPISSCPTIRVLALALTGFLCSPEDLGGEGGGLYNGPTFHLYHSHLPREHLKCSL